jgi:pyrimidine deaminase RibD-like protein
MKRGLAVAAEHGLVMKDPKPLVIFEDFGESALVFALYFWVDVMKSSGMQIQSDLRYMLEKRCRRRHHRGVPAAEHPSRQRASAADRSRVRRTCRARPDVRESDHEFMSRAPALAERSLTDATPNPRVGCVIVRDGRGGRLTQPPGSNHAEIEALLDARRNTHEVRGATVYVTLEPCSHFGRTPPCATALIEARVGRVIAAVEDPNPQVAGGGLEMLRSAGIEVRCGLLAQEAAELNVGFFSRMQRGRPFVRMKIAASLDGKTALETESRRITRKTLSRRSRVALIAPARC